VPLLPKPPLMCGGCPLFDDSKVGEKVGFSRPEGSGVNGVMIVGEALGESERADGLPFRPYAASGSILERAFRRLGLERDEFVLWNMVACRPPNNKLEGAWYESSAVTHCRRHFDSVYERFRPRVILALGNIPFKYITGMAGRNQSISMVRGFSLPATSKRPVTVGSFHPAYLARGARNLIGVLTRDIQLAVQLSGRLAAGEEIKHDVGTYDVNPSNSSLRAYLETLRDNPLWSVSYDIETDELERDATDESEAFGGRFGNITQIQFSWAPRMAVVCDWREPYIQFAKDVMALPNPKWGWNTWGYDDPRLEHYGVKINGESHDLMWAWHHLQPDVPRNLQFATSFYAPEMPPWKHTSGTDLATYGGADVDSVQRIGMRLFDDLSASGIAHGYRRHIVQLWPILKRMCQRGLPIDLEGKKNLKAKIEETINATFAEIQRLVPLEIRGIHPTAGYKVIPSTLRPLFAELGLVTAGKRKCTSFPDTLRSRAESLGFKCKEFDGVERFYVEKPFLPNSSDHLKGYLRHKGIPVPIKLKEKNEDGTPKETTEEKELEKLWKKTKDPIIGKVREYRKLGKILSTYIDGWPIGPDGRVHSTFTFATATGQLSSRSPNIQNAPKHGELANEFSKIIRAGAGYKIVSIDWTAFHALTLGFCARDRDYMRLARLDIHSYLAGHLLRLDGKDKWLSLPDEELSAVLSGIKAAHKPVRDKKAKPTILGYGFGLGASKLYDMNLESFESKKEAQAVIDMLNQLFPRTAGFREEIKERAAKEGLLRSPYGYLRRFQDVYSWQQVSANYEPKWGEKLWQRRDGRIFKRVSGDEGEAAIAYLPANTAYGHAKEVVLYCDEQGWLDRYGFINWVHDELRFECPDELVDRCVSDISSAMESRSKILVDSDVAPNGLACGVEASVGQSMAELKDVYKTPLEVIT
jgi:uracil-DNA glycosylase family 4